MSMTHGGTGTNSIPRELEIKLVEAKDWSDACPNAGLSDETARAEWNAQGVLLLLDIVEAVDGSWGFAPRRGEA